MAALAPGQFEEENSTMSTAKPRIRAIAALLAFGAVTLAAVPAAAQSGDADARLKKVEAEVRALQRKVFPDGAGKTLAPEITPAGTGPIVPPPATSAMTDVLGRLDSVESQLARLTAQTEENANGLTQLQTRIAALETARAQAAAAPPTDAVAPAQDLTDAAPEKVGPVEPAKIKPAPKPREQAPAKPTAARVAAVQAVPRPQTDDAADDEYTYGFRLWSAGFFPEAQQQLQLYLDKYPADAKVSYGRNLLGRAYLDDGKPKEAASWFLKNYQAGKDGARAPDSLLYLAESMVALKDTKKACIALAEFAKVYTALATGRLADQYEADRKKVTCN
jgi:TolA-binding protein